MVIWISSCQLKSLPYTSSLFLEDLGQGNLIESVGLKFIIHNKKNFIFKIDKLCLFLVDTKYLIT